MTPEPKIASALASPVIREKEIGNALLRVRFMQRYAHSISILSNIISEHT